MVRLRVTVKRLNKRSSIPAEFPDANSIAGEVFENTLIDAEEVPGAITNGGKWYKDRDGFFYWGGGVAVQAELAVRGVTLNGHDRDWWVSFFQLEKVWSFSKGENINVAILDSGLDFNLEPFSQKQNIKYFNAFTNSENRDDCRDNDGGHGTTCAGMACGAGNTLVGAAPNADLLVIKVTDQFGGRDPKAILTGIKKAVDAKCDVISLSLQLPDDDPNIEEIHSVIKQAFAQDITITASVGNVGGLPIPIDNLPASYPECLSIGGVDANKKRSNFSSKSNFLDLMGPGEAITSFEDAQSKVNGTSFSTPFVAGIIAILKSIAKQNGVPLTNLHLFDILKRSADFNIPNYNVIEYGFGIINPLSAIDLLNKIP